MAEKSSADKDSRGSRDSEDTSKASGRSKGKKSQAAAGVWRSEELSLLGIGMGVGDLDGDGNNEVVIIDPSTVYVYKVSGEQFSLVAEYGAAPLELKSVDVAKIRKQGPHRIYVTAQNRGTMSSFVLEFRNGSLSPVIQDARYFLRVIDYPTRGQVLLGQRKGLTKMFDGPIFRVEDKGSELEVGDRFGIPLKIPIYGFAIGDLEGKRRPLIAVYDKEDHLRVYEPSGKRVYISKAYYGGTDVVLRWLGPEDRRDTEGPDRDHEKTWVRPRMLSMDLDGDSAYEVLVITHSSKTRRLLSRSKMLEDGRVMGLSWNGDALAEKWSTPPTQGMISDFAVDYLPGQAGKRLILLERKKTDWLSFLRSRCQLKSYDLNQVVTEGIKDMEAE